MPIARYVMMFKLRLISMGAITHVTHSRHLEVINQVYMTPVSLYDFFHLFMCLSTPGQSQTLLTSVGGKVGRAVDL